MHAGSEARNPNFQTHFRGILPNENHKPTPQTYANHSLHHPIRLAPIPRGQLRQEYHAAIEPRGEGYIVTFAYGRRGNTLTTGIKSDLPMPLETATKLFDKLVASKLAKGYHYSSASAGDWPSPFRMRSARPSNTSRSMSSSMARPLATRCMPSTCSK